jgi:hypothetical protein
MDGIGVDKGKGAVLYVVRLHVIAPVQTSLNLVTKWKAGKLPKLVGLGATQKYGRGMDEMNDSKYLCKKFARHCLKAKRARSRFKFVHNFL